MSRAIQKNSRRFWPRWLIVLVASWLLINYFTAKEYFQKRYIDAQRQGAGIYLVKGEEGYRGRNITLGWPSRWLGLRLEAEDTTDEAPLALVHFKTSLIALGLNLLGIAALFTAGLQCRLLVREPISARRMIVLGICLAILVAVALLAQVHFLGRIPVYADDF